MADSEIGTWLIANCGMGASKAGMIADRLAGELWIDRVEALQQAVTEHPDTLDALEIPKPMLAILKSKLASFYNKNLVDLSTRDVQHVLFRIFPGENYADTLRNNRINGFVLSSAGSIERLIEWGVSSEIHAEALFGSIAGWKEKGVPNNLLIRDDQASVTTDSSVHEDDGLQKPMQAERKRKSTSEDASSDRETASKVSREDLSLAELVKNAGKQSRELASLLQETNPPPRPRPTTLARVSAPPPPMVKTARATTPAAARPAPAASKDTKSHKAAPKEPKERDFHADDASLTLNTRMKNLLKMLESEDKDAQVQALKVLSKQAADHPDTVGCIRNVGALDKMIEMLEQADSYDEYVVWRVLVALNNTIARAKLAHSRYLLERGLIVLVLPMVTSSSTRIRLQALWIIGNMGTTEGEAGFKSQIITHELVRTIVQSYETVNKLTGYTGPDNVRQRYAETIKQLSCDRTRQQFKMLRPFYGILRDIIQIEDNVEAVLDSCYAVDHLLDADDPSTVDAMIDADVIPALVSRLDDPKISITLTTLTALTVFAECCNSHQVLELELVVGHLDKFIVGSAGYKPNKKLTTQAVLCLLRICEGGDRSVQQIMDFAPDLFPTLVNLVQTATAGQSSVRTIAENAALALMCAVQGASNRQLAYFVKDLHMYSFTFSVLEIFAADDNILEEALRALSNMIFKLENAADVQGAEERRGEFNVEEAWAVVKNLSEQEQEPGTEETQMSEEEKGVESSDKQDVQVLAKELLGSAQALGLLVKD